MIHQSAGDELRSVFPVMDTVEIDVVEDADAVGCQRFRAKIVETSDVFTVLLSEARRRVEYVAAPRGRQQNLDAHEIGCATTVSISPDAVAGCHFGSSSAKIGVSGIRVNDIPL